MGILIHNGYVLTMNPRREVFEGGYVATADDGSIAAVGPAPAPPGGDFDEVVDAGGMIVVPGLINLHQHHWYNLFKGLAGGLLL